jgi:hypothetical protein
MHDAGPQLVFGKFLAINLHIVVRRPPLPRAVFGLALLLELYSRIDTNI